MKAIGYVRVSTGKQAESGLGLEDQRRKVRQYCELHDYELVEVYEDQGESGKDLEREGLKQALQALEVGDADCIVVNKVNRLTRHLGDLQDLIEQYFGDDGDYDLAAVSDHVDTSSANGRMLLNILMSVDQGERERIAERTRHALQLKRDRNEYTGGKVPFGKRLSDDGIHLEDNADEQDILRLIRELRDEGLTLADTADELNRRDIPRRNGNAWHAVAVSRVMKRAA